MHPLVNITLGFRYDHHDVFGGAFVPRIGLTKRIQNFHFKALYSHSYRAPGIENINLNEDIRPEKTKTVELELGYQFTKDMLLMLNSFYIDTRDIIVYGYTELEDGDWEEYYENSDKAGSKGLELIYRYYKDKFRFNTNYSLYTPIKNNTTATYQVPGNESIYVGFPNHKLNARLGYEIKQNFWADLGVIYRSKRYGYTDIDEDEYPVIGTLDPFTKVNFSLGYDNLFTKGLNIKASAVDLFNSKAAVLQPYNGDFAPIPGRSREFRVKLMYNISWSAAKK